MKFDLSELNKTSQQSVKSSASRATDAAKSARKKALQLLRKQKGPLRDFEGKFTTGKGGLKSLQKFNWKRSMPAIAVVTLVGGAFVIGSFAATPSTPYQYSIYTCEGFNPLTATSTSCVTQSAEYAVYGAYTDLLKREPDNSGYAYWVQNLVGNHVSVSAMRAAIANSKEGQAENPKPTTPPPAAKQPTCTLEIKGKVAKWDAYDIPSGANWGAMLSRPGGNVSYQPISGSAAIAPPKGATTYTVIIYDKAVSSSGAQNSWKTACADDAHASHNTVRFAAKQVLKTRASIAASWLNNLPLNFAATTPTSGFNFFDFIKKAPRVSVVETATETDDSRVKGAIAINNVSKKEYEATGVYIRNTQKRVTDTAALAAKTSPSQRDLDVISANLGQAKRDLVKVQKVATDTKNRYDGVKKLYDEYPSNAQLKEQLNIAIVYKVVTQNYVTDMNTGINQIQGNYNVTKGKYDAQHKPPAQPGGSGNPCQGVGSGSSKDKIKACQGYLGVATDGAWGPKTEAAYQKKFGRGSGWSPPSGGGSGGGNGGNGCPAGYIRKDGECRPAPSTPPQPSAPTYRCPSGYFRDGSDHNRCVSNSSLTPTCPLTGGTTNANDRYDNKCTWGSTAYTTCPSGYIKRRNQSDGKYRCRTTANEVRVN